MSDAVEGGADGASSADAPQSWTVLPGYADERLDRFLCAMRDDTSRAHAQDLIDGGQVQVDGRHERASFRLSPGQVVSMDWRTQTELRGEVDALPEGLVCLFEDEEIVVLDKAPGLVVHPGGPYKTGTVAQLAELRFGPLSRLGGQERPGIVHRLDKETSGVLLLAKTDAAYTEIQRQFRERETGKEYFAISHGHARFASEWIHSEIDRDERHPERMRVVREGGRESSTYFEVVERFDGFTHLMCRPKTGRTHQIRVHLAAHKLPIVKDMLYPLRQRNALKVPESAPPLDRHALHARALTITHPKTGEQMTFEAPVPEDLEAFVAWLRREKPESGKRRGR